MIYQFYGNSKLLFVLGDAAEYDTATPYRYAVGRFVQLADEIKNGHSIMVVSRNNHEKETVLDTVAQLLGWIAVHFAGFDHFVQAGIDAS